MLTTHAPAATPVLSIHVSASKTLSLFGQTFDINANLLQAAGLDDDQAHRYQRNVQIFAGFLIETGSAEKALMMTAGYRARVRDEADANTARQKIAEIERQTAEIRLQTAIAASRGAHHA